MSSRSTTNSSRGRSLPAFSVGNGALVPIAKYFPGTREPFVPSVTKIGPFKYVRRWFDYQSLRVVSEEEENLALPSKKRTADGERKPNGREHDANLSKNIGEAWVDPDAVDHNGYLTSIIKPLSSRTSYYSYYTAAADSPLPDLQMAEAGLNCEDSFNFRSKMYCQNEQYRLTLPYEIRSMIYAHAFEHYPQPGEEDHDRVVVGLLKTLPTVCRFLYLDIITFIHTDYFQLYFRHPHVLQGHLEKLDMKHSPFSKRQLGLRRLRCVVLDLDRHSTAHPEHSLFVQCRRPVVLWKLQEARGLTPRAKVDLFDFAIKEARHVPKMHGREPTDWAVVLLKLLEEYEIGKLVIRIGRGNTRKWRQLPQKIREVVEQGASKVAEWQVATNVGGWKYMETGS
jgi:hypothetical protein